MHKGQLREMAPIRSARQARLYWKLYQLQYKDQETNDLRRLCVSLRLRRRCERVSGSAGQQVSGGSEFVALQGDSVSGPASIDNLENLSLSRRQTAQTGANSQEFGLAGRQKAAKLRLDAGQKY